MGLTEVQVEAILAEASGGPMAPWIPTYDCRTGRIYFPGQGSKAQRPHKNRAKKKSARKRARLARRRTRRRK